ncbi:hypothetical protein ACFWBF_20745 [Streptomyces sp. NPDC060028]|uniref:hypothetical protein n=1 Tax=Streptomyces sp. NPDC060028 TaxID=3347041 RepID=UPI0036A2C96E
MGVRTSVVAACREQRTASYRSPPAAPQAVPYCAHWACGNHPGGGARGLFLRQSRLIGYRSDVAELVGLDDADHAPFGVVHHDARPALDPVRPEGGAELPDPAEHADEQVYDARASATGLPIARAVPPPSPWNTTSGASMPSSASMSPPSAASKNPRANSSPSSRRAGDGALP